MPPLSRDRLVVSGAGLLAGALLLTLLLNRVTVSPESALVVLGWLVGAAQLLGAVLLGGGVVLREQARRSAPPLGHRAPQVDWYGT